MSCRAHLLHDLCMIHRSNTEKRCMRIHRTAGKRSQHDTPYALQFLSQRTRPRPGFASRACTRATGRLEAAAFLSFSKEYFHVASQLYLHVVLVAAWVLTPFTTYGVSSTRIFPSRILQKVWSAVGPHDPVDYFFVFRVFIFLSLWSILILVFFIWMIEISILPLRRYDTPQFLTGIGGALFLHYIRGNNCTLVNAKERTATKDQSLAKYSQKAKERIQMSTPQFWHSIPRPLFLSRFCHFLFLISFSLANPKDVIWWRRWKRGGEADGSCFLRQSMPAGGSMSFQRIGYLYFILFYFVEWE